jgi:type IV fimbrial biogenesis protein FimT
MCKPFELIQLIGIAKLARLGNFSGSARLRRTTGNALVQFVQFDSGFTSIELMIALAIVSILMIIGIPAYSNFITSSHIVAESSSLLDDMEYARSQAIKQGYPVSICAANTSGAVGSYACNGTSTWSNGWIVYTGNTTGVIASANALRVQSPLTTTDTMTSTSTTQVFQLCFNAFGFSSINYNAAVNACVPSALKGSITVAPHSGSVTSQTVCVSAVGNALSVAGGDTLCP